MKHDAAMTYTDVTPATSFDNPDPLLTVAEAAKCLGVSGQFVYRATSDGTLAKVRMGRAIRLRLSTLEAFIAAGGAR